MKEINLDLIRITKTESDIKNDIFKRVFKGEDFDSDTKLTLTVEFEKKVPSDWDRLIGSSIGNIIQLVINPKSTQGKLE